MSSPTAHLPIPTAYEPASFTPSGLWDFAVSLAWSVAEVLGLPIQIAHEAWMPRAEWMRARGWLAAAEGLVRRMLLVDALALAGGLTDDYTNRPRRMVRTQPASAPTIGRADIDPDQPQSWRAPFDPLGRSAWPRRTLDPAANSGAARPCLRRLSPHGFVSSFGLACRLEALRRVLALREARPLRLAHRLKRMQSAGATLAAPALDPDRSPWGYWHLAHAQALLEDALTWWREPG